MATYIFTTPVIQEAPENTHRLFQFWTINKGLTVTRTGSSYSVGRWYTDDELADVDEYWLGGHKHSVSEATKAGLIAANIGITESNFVAE